MCQPPCRNLAQVSQESLGNAGQAVVADVDFVQVCQFYDAHGQCMDSVVIDIELL